MKIPFWKMHGAANDFILVDDREESFPADDGAWIAEISARRTGVGSDGVILIQPSESADFRMRFFNPDGGEVEMCGNGARCVARLARDIGVAGSDMRFDTVAGVVRAECAGEELVLLHLTEPSGLELNRELDLNGTAISCHVVNTGVPHVVVPVDDVENARVQDWGSGIRHHDSFAPAGTNVNFMQVTGPNALSVRTYERGVERETWACGTGIVACGITATLSGQASQPVQITARSGDRLTVDFQRAGETVTDVTLLGPAVYVCTGELEYP